MDPEEHKDLDLSLKKKFKKKKLKNKDQIEQRLKFQAYANPDYTTAVFLGCVDQTKLADLDPLRRSFVLSKYAQYLKDVLPEHAAQYEKIETRCDDFTTSLLGLCTNIEEIKILLEYSPEEKKQNWHMALYNTWEHLPYLAG